MAANSPDTTEAAKPRRRRMAPDDRRQHILEAARELFARRPYRTVSTADVAEHAGVARSLVHHYFGGIRDVFLAVIADGAVALTAARSAGPEVPFEERTAHNLRATLDVIGANRETWLAVAGHGVDPDDEEIYAVVLGARRWAIERALVANADVVADTPTARFAFECFNEFIVAAIRSWLRGEHTREETEALLLVAGRTLMQQVIPALSPDPDGPHE